MPAWFSYLLGVRGCGVGWGRKSTVHFQQDPGLTGGFSRLLPALGSHPPLRLLRDRAPTGVRGPRRPVGDDALRRFQEGRWGQGGRVRNTPDPSAPKAKHVSRTTQRPATGQPGSRKTPRPPHRPRPGCTRTPEIPKEGPGFP